VAADAGDAMDIYGVGRLIEWREWWRLVYYGCGHETRFVRTAHRLFDDETAERVVIESYSVCGMCHPPKRPV
jgi:hypothetical protein